MLPHTWYLSRTLRILSILLHMNMCAGSTWKAILLHMTSKFVPHCPYHHDRKVLSVEQIWQILCMAPHAPPKLPPIQDMACQCRARMMSPGVSITMESDIAMVMMSLLYQILLFKQCLCLFRVPQWAFVLENAQPIKGSSWLNVCVCIWKALNQVNVDRSLLLTELKTRSALSSPLLPVPSSSSSSPSFYKMSQS